MLQGLVTMLKMPWFTQELADIIIPSPEWVRSYLQFNAFVQR